MVVDLRPMSQIGSLASWPLAGVEGQSRADAVSAGYRPELQGLRALAVLLVSIYHIWPSVLPAGFVGVDVFFVISGFLITGLLVKEAERSDRIRLVDFWARRMRRLLPAASVVLLSTLAATVALLPATRWLDVARDVAASAVYLQNWNLADQAVDYAARGMAPSPVQHFWSLSIEEQFYLVWPVLIYGLHRLVGRRRTRTWLAPLALVLFVISLAWSTSIALAPGAAYFATTTRVWELALGGMLAAIEVRLILPEWYRLVLSWVGIAAILVSALVLPSSLAFPGWIALLPTLGTVLVIAARNSGDWSLAPILTWGPVRFLGDISYSLYLWHWPVILLLPLVPGAERMSLNEKGVLFAVSLLLATVTKMFIEDPFRRGKLSRLSPRSVLFVGALLMGTVAVSAGGLMAEQKRAMDALHASLMKQRLEMADFRVVDSNHPGAAALGERAVVPAPGAPLKPDPLVARLDVPRVYNDGCDLKQIYGASICEYGDPAGRVKVALLGDSHAAQYVPALEALATHYHWRLLVLEKSACFFSTVPVTVRQSGAVRWDCEQWKKQATELLLAAQPSIILTTAAFPDIYNEYYWLPTTKDLVAGYHSAWQRFTERGIPVLAIRDNPRPTFDAPTCVWQNRASPQLCAPARTVALDRHEDPQMLAAAGQDRVFTLDLSGQFCEGATCPLVIGNILVYRDGDHLTATYARTLAPAIGRKMLEILPAE